MERLQSMMAAENGASTRSKREVAITPEEMKLDSTEGTPSFCLNREAVTIIFPKFSPPQND